MPELSLDESSLTTVVRHALGSPTAHVTSWQLAPVSYQIINRITAGLYRLTGTATDHTGTQPWSIFLKILQHATPDDTSTFNSSDDPAHWNYWRREAYAYTSDLTEQCLPTIGFPQCYAITAPTPDTQWLWMEDIQGLPATQWPLARFQLAARHLGHWQGQYARNQPLPAMPWLSRCWLRAWVPGADTVALDVIRTPRAWQHPLLPATLSPTTAQAVLRLWQERDHLLDAIERLPQTVCHLDFWPPNLIARQRADGQEQTVLLDWSQVGIGAYAEDIANLVLDSGWMFWIDHTDLAECEQLAWTGYLAGLRDAGWVGSQQNVCFAYAATAALRFGLLAGMLLRQAQNEQQHAEIEQRYQRSMDQIIAQRAAVVAHALALAAEARSLLPRIG